uniref:Uncharacterized protein n=1 Tax=Romanomermis culicivorax TaxID=13658 RepID=A0A915HJG2_ROMCU
MNYSLVIWAVLALIAVASSHRDESESRSEEHPEPVFEMERGDHYPSPWDEDQGDSRRKFESDDDFEGDRWSELESRRRHHRRRGEEGSSSEEHPPRKWSSGEFEHRRHHGRWHPGRRHHRRHFPFRRHHRRHGCRRRFHHHCPKHGAWQESACLWPGQETKIPESCHANFSAFLPKAVAEYYKNKAQEFKSVVETLFKKRGITKACGFCSKKLACRKRKFWKKHGCKPIEFAFVKEECQEDNNACELSLVDGACPPPIPQKKAVKHNKLVARRRHFRHKGPMEFHGRRFGFEQSHLEWNNEQGESNSEESASHETSSENGSSESGQNGAATITPATDGTKDANATLRRSARSAENEWESGNQEFGEGHHRRHGDHHHKRYSPFIPLWHCVKSKQGDKCLCCCGGYFPDADTGKCIAVQGGNRFPPIPIGAW